MDTVGCKRSWSRRVTYNADTNLVCLNNPKPLCESRLDFRIRNERETFLDGPNTGVGNDGLNALKQCGDVE